MAAVPQASLPSFVPSPIFLPGAAMSHVFDEKHPVSYASDGTPIASGVRTNSSDDGMRRGSRKGSVVDMLKSGYGLAEKPGDLDQASLKVGIDLTHRKLKPRHIQLIGTVSSSSPVF